MAVNVKSTSITNADATPRVPNDSWFDTGTEMRVSDFAVVGASDAINSTYRCIRVRSGDRIAALTLSNDAANTSGVAGVSVYETAANGGALAGGTPGGALLFAASVDVHTAAFFNKDIMFNVTTVPNINKRVWELLGLTVDPFKEYDLAVIMTTAGSVGANVALAATILR